MTKLDQIKKLLFGDAAPQPIMAPAPVSLAKDYILVDGTTVSIDKLEVGGMVTVAGIPATEGEYALNDGTVLKVDANGILTEVDLPMKPGVLPMNVVAAPVDYSKQFSELEAKIKGLKDQFENDLSIATGKLAKQETILKELFAVIEEIGNMPKGNPVEKTAGKFSKQDEKEERLKSLQENLKRIKNFNN